MKRLTIHMLHWTATIMDIVQGEMNLPSPDLSQFVRQKSQLWKISELQNLLQTKLPTSSSDFNFMKVLWTRNMKYQYEIR